MEDSKKKQESCEQDEGLETPEEWLKRFERYADEFPFLKEPRKITTAEMRKLEMRFGTSISGTMALTLGRELTEEEKLERERSRKELDELLSKDLPDWFKKAKEQSEG